MANSSKTKPNPKQKESVASICDPENYLEIITGCLTEEQAALMRPHHMANFMALAAELFLTNFTGIATAFEKQNGLEIVFKANLASGKDTVDVTYKPVAVYKDSASLNLPEEEDEKQATMDFGKKKPEPQPEPVKPSEVVVEAEVLALPAPKEEPLALPAPKPMTAQEDDAYSHGQEAAAEGLMPDANPYDEDPDLFQVWRKGWYDQRNAMQEAEEAQSTETENKDASDDSVI